MVQDIQQPPQEKSGKEQQKKPKRLLSNMWRAIKDNVALAGVLATLVAAVIGLPGALYQRHVNATIAQQEAKQRQELEDQQRQESEVQTYFDDIGKLLLDKDHPLRKAQPTDDVSALAQAKTLVLLGGINSKHKSSVARFLHDAGLIQRGGSIINLEGLNLENSNHIGATLSDANLRGVDLDGADLRDTSLNSADLSHADLEGTDLSHTALFGADLTSADLRWADLTSADLTRADLKGTNLGGADLTGARGATKELEQVAKSLQGTTMPDGSKHD